MLDALTPLLPISQAHAEEAASGISALPQLLLLVGFVAIFYFLIIRPQSKRAKAHKQLVANLGAGDEVATSSGLMGRVVKIHEGAVELELAANLTVQMQKNHVTSVLPKGTLKGGK